MTLLQPIDRLEPAPCHLKEIITPSGDMGDNALSKSIIVVLEGGKSAMQHAEDLALDFNRRNTEGYRLTGERVGMLRPKAELGHARDGLLKLQVDAPHEMNALEALAVVHKATGCGIGAKVHASVQRINGDTSAVGGGQATQERTGYCPSLNISIRHADETLATLVARHIKSKLRRLMDGHGIIGNAGRLGLPREYHQESGHQEGGDDLHHAAAVRTPTRDIQLTFSDARSSNKHQALLNAQMMGEYISGMLGIQEIGQKYGMIAS